MTPHRRKKKIEIITDRVNIIEFKSMISKTKDLLEGINSKFEPPKETISKLKKRSTEIVQPE